jgi:hypothetical protein
MEVDAEGILNGAAASEAAFLAAFQAEVEDQLAVRGSDETWETIQAGLILTFGPILSPDNTGPGSRLAAAINALITAEAPFADAVVENYISFVYITDDLDQVNFNIYLYTTRCEDA